MKLVLAGVVVLAAVRTDSAADSANRGPRPRSHLECCGTPQDVELQPLPIKCAATLQAALHPVHANSGRQPALAGGKGPPDTMGPCTFTIAGDLRNSGIGPALGSDGNRSNPAVVPALYLSLGMEVTGPRACDGSYVTVTMRAGAMRSSPSPKPKPFYHHRFAFWPTRRADLRGGFDGSRSLTRPQQPYPPQLTY